MASQLNPYISFNSDARQAMEFYQSVFGGKLDISTFGDFNVSDDPAEKDKVMHAMLNNDKGVCFMASDTPAGMPYQPGKNISMSLSGPVEDEEELRGYWGKLSSGGTVTMPLEKAMWGDTFGMVTDKFGIDWMVNIGGKSASQN